MKLRFVKLAAASLGLACGLGLSVPASAQNYFVNSGESTDLFAVYWVANCRSMLKSFDGVEILEGGLPGVTVSLREEPVRATRQNCSDSVPGATLVVTAKDITEKSAVNLKLRVNYLTESGPRQSTHNFRLAVYPK